MNLPVCLTIWYTTNKQKYTIFRPQKIIVGDNQRLYYITIQKSTLDKENHMVYHARARAREPRAQNGVLSCVQRVPNNNKPSTTGYTFSTPFCTPFYITRQLNIFI